MTLTKQQISFESYSNNTREKKILDIKKYQQEKYLNNPYRQKTNHCKDCGIIICDISTKCRKCSKRGNKIAQPKTNKQVE